MASVTSDPRILSQYSVPCSLWPRFIKKEDLLDSPSDTLTSIARTEEIPPQIITSFLTNKKMPLRPHRSFLSAAHRYNFIPQLRSTMKEYSIEDLTYTVLGPSRLVSRLSARAAEAFQSFHVCDLMVETNPPERVPKDVICKLEREVEAVDGTYIAGERLDITSATSSEINYEKPVGRRGISEEADWLIVVITKGKDELTSMPLDSDFGIGCRNVAETVNNVCSFLWKCSPRINFSRRSLVHVIESLFLSRFEIALHLKEGHTHLLRSLEKAPYKTTVGIVKNAEGSSYPWRAFVILSQKKKYPLLGRGADSVVTFAAEISASPQLFASLACYGDYDNTLRAIKLHKEFEPWAVKIEAYFAPYNKVVTSGGKKFIKNVVRIIQELYETNLAAHVRKEFKEKGSFLPVKKVLAYTHFIVGFLKAFHAKGLAHRDIKASNILFKKEKDGKEKLAITDFVRACFISDESLLKDLDTTHTHIDPSMAQAFCRANGSQSSRHYAFIDLQAADMWALGITMLSLMLQTEELMPKISDRQWLAYKDTCLDMNPDPQVQEHIRYAYAITVSCADPRWATKILKSKGYIITSSEVETLIEGLLDPNPHTRLTAHAAEAALAKILYPSAATTPLHSVPMMPYEARKKDRIGALVEPSCAGAGRKDATASTVTDASIGRVLKEEARASGSASPASHALVVKLPPPDAALKAALAEASIRERPAGVFRNLKNPLGGLLRAFNYTRRDPLLTVEGADHPGASSRIFPLFSLNVSAAAKGELPGPGNSAPVPDHPGTVVIVETDS